MQKINMPEYKKIDQPGQKNGNQFRNPLIAT
jgi:hypothetical protein